MYIRWRETRGKTMVSKMRNAVVATTVMAVAVMASPVQAYEPVPPNVFVYRAYAEPTLAGAIIRIDGVRIARLNNHDYAQYYVSPGRHTVTLTWPWWSRQVSSEITLTVGERSEHYLKVTGISQQTDFHENGFGGYEMEATMDSSLSEVPPSRGAEELDACCRS
jgi:hypothetical protein